MVSRTLKSAKAPMAVTKVVEASISTHSIAKMDLVVTPVTNTASGMDTQFRSKVTERTSMVQVAEVVKVAMVAVATATIPANMVT